ncbi:MAG: sulfatase, partial [Verrucomicrobiota bacterium]
MTTRKFLVLVSLFLGTAFAERPNILLILSDDHSLPHVGTYSGGNCAQFGLTPNLDELSRQGMLFHRAYTSAPQCAPSRAAIFSGRSPIGIAATRFAQPARPGTPLFTDLLRESGYWVGIDGRHQHLEGRSRELPHVNQTLIELGIKGPEFEDRFDHFVPSWSTKKEPEKAGEYIGEILDSVPEGKPWFLYFGFNQPHRKWGEDHDGIDPAKLILPPDWPDLPEVRLDYARYLSDVRDLDRGMGSVLEMLNNRDLKENTMVIFMGDNGEALLRGKGTLHTRGTHVPLIVRWHGKTPPSSHSPHLISGIDLAPTILDAAEAEPVEGMNGRSFLNVLLGKSVVSQEFVFCERGWHWGSLMNTEGFDLSRSVTSDRYHYIYNAIPEREFAPVDMTR